MQTKNMEQRDVRIVLWGYLALIVLLGWVVFGQLQGVWQKLALLPYALLLAWPFT